jgi:hypothetical protein
LVVLAYCKRGAGNVQVMITRIEDLIIHKKGPRRMSIKPRGEYVLIRRVVHGQTPSGIRVSEASFEGMDHVVEAFGSGVTDLHIGDKVLLIVTNREDYAFLPNSKDLLITKHQNIVLVYGEE